jgi:poly(beta-D-mannuronate) lyase
MNIRTLSSLLPAPAADAAPRSPGRVSSPSLSRRLRHCGAVALALCTFAAHAATINVSSSSGLATAVANANPGDEIVLANGNYAAFTMTRDGTSSSPILIRAANQNGAVINSGVLQLNGTSYVTLQGLMITTSGGSRTVDGETINVAVWLEQCFNCRVTRCTLRLSGAATQTHWILLGGHSDNNRIDYCEFGPNTVDGCHYIWPRGQRDIPGVTPPSDRTSWADGNGPVNPNIPLHTRIDHNYFHDQAAGTAEVIILGGLGVTGDYQNYGSVVEYNLFTNCDGDPEFISVKSSNNTIRYNTVRTCAGMFSLRAGNASMVYGNFMFQGGKSGAGGIKIYEKDHAVFNNYIDNASEYPILVGAGDKYNGGSFAHAQVFRAKILNNTVVNLGNRPVIIGHGSTDLLPPTDMIFANNIIQGTAATLFDERVAPVGSSVYSSNIASGGSGYPGGFTVTNPNLTTVNGMRKLSSTSPAINAGNESVASLVVEDMDGQDRNDLDIGADEFSSAPIEIAPLTTADVGPSAPPEIVQVAAPSFNPPAGNYTSTQTVTISTSTAGASIHYTIDGSVPTSSTGIAYTGPITISSTTTLKAIAFASGLADSTVTSGTYTINPVSGTAWEAESLAFTASGATATIDTDAAASGGQRVTLNSTATGQYVEFTLPSVPAGTYSVQLAYKTNGNRGQSTFKMDGTTFGGTLDQYAATATYPTATLGTVTFSSTASHAFRMTVSGKNASSSSYTLSADKIILTPTAPTLTWEAENLSFTTSGVSATIDTDTSASNGARVTLNATGTGSWLQFTLPNVPAGTYQVKLTYKTNNNRGQCTFQVDGGAVGGTLDQYASSASYPTATIATVTLATTGNHTFRMTVTGKNASSSSYTLSADKITLAGQ